MNRQVDLLSSATLKHLREHWWDDSFTAFVRDTLQPRPGRRILHVGSGRGEAEVNLSRLRLTQIELVGIDLVVDRVQAALAATRAHNIRAGFAAADACRLPFGDATFDSTFTVAVLQHIKEPHRAVAEIARVTRPGGRVLAVEPDNAARFFYSSSEAGMRAYELAGHFFAGLTSASGDATDASVGPKLPTLFAQHGIDPLDVHLFPVSRTQLGPPPETVWEARRTVIRDAADRARDDGLRRLGQDYLKALEKYAVDASAAGPGFVEIQNTMLFGAVGQRAEA